MRCWPSTTSIRPSLRILLDQNAPKGLTGLLAEHEVARTSIMGWAELTNGDLLAAAEAAGFEVMITADQNLRYQQNLAMRRIALVVLPTNNWSVLRENARLINQAVEAAGQGSYRQLVMSLPVLRRRLPPRLGH